MEQSLDMTKSLEDLQITEDVLEQSSDIAKCSEDLQITRDVMEQPPDMTKPFEDLQITDTAKSAENLQIKGDFIANPVGSLQENYQHFGTPVYSLFHSKGESHAPTFSYKVTLGDLSAVGTGNSKKYAKHATAQAMLDLLGHHKSQDKLPSQELSEEGLLSKLDIKKSVGNTVGDLQEMCEKKGLQMPNFELDHIVGQSHNSQFYMACVLGEFREIGVAGSKKDAKRDAAQNMIKNLTVLQIL